MNKRTLAYWIATGLLAAMFTMGGFMDLTLGDPVVQQMRDMGYPDYFTRLLGVWKLLGVLAILAPAPRRLREWAYAGLFFDLSGAVISHIAVGTATDSGGAVLGLVLWAISWRLFTSVRHDAVTA